MCNAAPIRSFSPGLLHVQESKRVTLLAGDNVKQVVQVLDSIFEQLSTYSLEELGISKPEDVSWKDAEGFNFQLLAYSLLGIYDITCSNFVDRLTAPDLSSSTAAQCIGHIMDCHRRLHDMLSCASRIKRLQGMLSPYVHS